MEVIRRRRFDFNDLLEIMKHSEVTGACECGRWHIISSTDSKSDPVICKCGNKFYQIGSNQVICERDE